MIETQITLPTTTIIYDISVFEQMMLVACESGLYCSTDNGTNWHNVYDARITDSEIPTLAVQLSPNFIDDGQVVAGVKGGTMMSVDSGKTWQAHQFRNPPPMVTSVAFSHNFAIDQTILVGTYEDGMFRSTDGGITWQAVNFGLFDHNILCVTTSPKFETDQTAYAGTSTGIYKSTNGGQLWHDVRSAFDQDAVLSLAVSYDGNVYAGTESMGLYKSYDGGATWTVIHNTDGAINSILFPNNLQLSQHLIIQVDDGVVMSDDGTTWHTIIANDVSTIILGHDDGTIIAGMTDATLQQFNIANS